MPIYDGNNKMKISGIQSIFSGNNKVYSSAPTPVLYCTVSGLGSENPTDVVFSNNTIKNWTPEEVTISGNVFVKFPKMYRKILTSSNGQITSFKISNVKEDDNFQVYPCFLKEDGITEMDYILIGKYMCSSNSVANSVNATYVTQTLDVGRTNAKL